MAEVEVVEERGYFKNITKRKELNGDMSPQRQQGFSLPKNHTLEDLLDQWVPQKRLDLMRMQHIQHRPPKKRKPISYRLKEDKVKQHPRLELTEFVELHNSKRQFRVPPIPTSVASVLDMCVKR